MNHATTPGELRMSLTPDAASTLRRALPPHLKAEVAAILKAWDLK
jgi:hypothetical protein